MKNFKRKERRVYIRLSAKIPVKFRVFSDDGNKSSLTGNLEGTTENISMTGIRLEVFCTNEQINLLATKNCTLTIQFQLPGTRRKIESEAKVINYITTEAKTVYLNAHENGINKKLLYAGLRFVNISEKNKGIIADYITNKFISGYHRVREGK